MAIPPNSVFGGTPGSSSAVPDPHVLLTTLAAVGGALLVGFSQVGTGAVVGTVQSQLQKTTFASDWTTTPQYTAARDALTGTLAVPNLYVNGTLTVTSSLLWSADNTIDIGAVAANRPRTGYFGTSVVTPFLAVPTRLVVGSTNVYTDSVLVHDGSITGATTAYAIRSIGTVQSGVTNAVLSFVSSPSTAAAAFNITVLQHFTASGGTIGAGSSVTSQFGFYVDPSLTGATNNYGFYGNLASGANRWNFYAGGTANNAFAGNVRIGSTIAPTVALDVTGQSIVTTSGSTATLSLVDTGASGANLKFTGDGGTTPNKYLRTSGGTLQLVNSAYTNVVLSVSDLGSLQILAATAITAGGTTSVGYSFSNTANFGIYFGSGAPTLSAAKGSLYLRSDGTTNVTRTYINTDGGTTWTAINTVA
jgi:hypothetical protein